MNRKVILILLAVVALVAVNVAFINNLKNLPYANYYLLLLAINIDLLALVIISAIILRKLIKVYLGRKRNILRRKLANILFLYLFIPLLILNVASIVVVLQSTKTYLSSKTRALSSYAERVYRNLYSQELERVDMYKSVLKALLERGDISGARRLKGVDSIVEVPKCEFEVSEGEFGYTLCLKAGRKFYKVGIVKDIGLIRDLSNFGQLALDLRAFVKTRDIITGIFIFFIVFIALLTLLATVWLGMLVARHISKPIESLSLSAIRISKGKLDAEIEEFETGDEIEELSKAFKKMRDNLKSIYDQLVQERNFLEKLLDSIPVGVVFVGYGGQVRINRTLKEMFKGREKVEEIIELAKNSPNMRVQEVRVGDGKIYLIEDVTPVVLSERFKTWQEAVKRIAHEIKNPLTPIRLNLERIVRYTQRGSLDEDKLQELVSTILKEIDRISELINQFKHLSADRKPKFREMTLSEVIEDLKKIYSSTGLEITLRGDRKITGDPDMLREMFYNLINNSIEGGASRIELVVSDGRLEYRDNGKGIEEKDLENVFLPYYTKNPKGMGLGMAIVKKIAQDHGWDIRALPSDRGAYFVVDFRSRN